MRKYQVQNFAESLNISVARLFEDATIHIYGKKCVDVNDLQIQVNNFYASEEVPAYVKMYILYKRRAS